MRTLNTEYRFITHEELIISAASKTSITGATAGIVGMVSQDGCLETIDCPVFPAGENN